MPQDQFQLYLLGSVITARFATGLAALHGFVVTLMVASAVTGHLSWRRTLRALLVSLVIMGGTMWLLGEILQRAIPYAYDKDASFVAMEALLPRVEVVDTEATPLSTEQLARTRISVIRERGTIRVGYSDNRLPLAYRNELGQAVGFDMDLVHGLAADIGVGLEVYRVKREELLERMNDGRIDLVVGGWSITPDRALAVDFSRPYLRHNLGLMVIDSRRSRFASVKEINESEEELRLGFPMAEYYRTPVQNLFPNAELVDMASPRSFLRGEEEELDGVVYSAEWGSAWTLLYPNFTIVVPQGMRIAVPMGIGLPLNDMQLKRFIDTWLELKQDNGLLDELFDYWILGKSKEEQLPRWSILNDVLGVER